MVRKGFPGGTAYAKAERSEKACWVQKIANPSHCVSCGVWHKTRWSRGGMSRGQLWTWLPGYWVWILSWKQLGALKNFKHGWQIFMFQKHTFQQCGGELEGTSMEAESSQHLNLFGPWIPLTKPSQNNTQNACDYEGNWLDLNTLYPDCEVCGPWIKATLSECCRRRTENECSLKPGYFSPFGLL